MPVEVLASGLGGPPRSSTEHVLFGRTRSLESGLPTDKFEATGDPGQAIPCRSVRHPDVSGIFLTSRRARLSLFKQCNEDELLRSVPADRSGC